MRLKITYALALAGMLSSSIAFADVNLSAQHQLVSATNVAGGSDAVFDITITNNGSDNLNALVFMAVDSNTTQNMSAPVFEISSLGAGSQTTLRVTFNAHVDSSYFDNTSLLQLNANAYNDLGEKISTSVIVEGEMQ